MVWSLALSLDDVKQDPVVYDAELGVAFLAKGHTVGPRLTSGIGRDRCFCATHEIAFIAAAINACTYVQYVRMVITYIKRMDQPGKVANPARGQLNRES